MALLSAQNLACLKGDRELFSGLTFTLEAAQVLHLQGLNGAGKTSLLRMLVGLVAPANGQILFNHEPIVDNPDFKRNLIYLGHKVGLNLHLSALENLRFWQQLHSETGSTTEPEFIAPCLFELLKDIGLVGLEDIPVGQLSAGQQRRVALCRLWLKPANLWVLDEPFTALDVDAIQLVMAKIEQQVSSGGSVLLTSHQPLTLSVPVQTLRLSYQW